MILRCFILTAAILITITANAQTGADTKNNADNITWLSYTDTAYQFSFKYPSSGWTLKLPNTNTRFFVTSHPENDADNFRENINCIVRKIEQPDFDIKAAEAEILKSIAEKMVDFKLVSSGYIKWNNVTALVLDYTVTSKADGIAYNIHMRQQMAVVNNLLFTISYTADAANYNKYLPTIKKIIQSVKLQ